MEFYYKIFLFLFISQISFLKSDFSLAQQNINGSFSFKGNNRTYILHIPASYNASVEVPLVLNLHGYGSTASQQQFYAMFDNISDTADFIVAYPNAINSVWDTVLVNSSIDDIGFLSALIDTVSKKYKIDSLRIYSTGLSMGGVMTGRLGCELSNRIAAIASVAGPMIQPFFPEYVITPSIPVLHIHGTSDSTILYDGGNTWPSVDTVIQYFVNKNNCLSVPDTFSFPDINTSDGCTVTKYHFGVCADSTEVVFYKVFNGGHTWPGGFIDIPNLGNTNRDFKASAEIWNFFGRHKLNPNATFFENTIDENDWVIYPNPGDGKFQLTIANWQLSIEKIIVYNVLGEIIFSLSYSGSPIPPIIDLSNYPKGVYFLKVSDGENIFKTEKIIVE